MTIAELAGAVLIISGVPFFLAGTIGLLRFPDVYTRLHALTKADNVGLGLIVAGLICQADSVSEAALLVVIWLLVLFASATSCYLVACAACRNDIRPWTRQ